MDSPTHLLRVAVAESNPEARMQQVVRACKLITDLLPFDRKNHALLEEPDIMKYLFLAVPLNPRVIDLIITSMIDKFKQLPYFLKEIWSGFLSIAMLEEEGNVHIPKSESAVKNFRHGVKKLLNIMSLKDLDNFPTTPSTRLSEYCEDVDRNREFIKLVVLDYVERILQICTKQTKPSSTFKPDIPGLVKKFIMHSPSDKVVIKVCSMMEKISFFSKDSMLNHEIEEIVLSKQSMVLDQQKYLSKTSLDESRVKPKSNLYSKAKGKLLSATEAGRFLGDNLRPSLRSLKEEHPSKEQDMQISFNPKHQQAYEMPRDELDNEILAQSRYDNFEESTDAIEARLDEWLSWDELDETPLISKSVYIYNIIKNPGNLEVILAFIFDPQCYTVGECWKSKYPSIAESLDENSILNQSTTSPVLKFQKIRDDKSLQPYMMRSYKAMQVLCDVRNMKVIMQANPKALENYFSFLYACLNTKEEQICNFNHIAKITEYLLKKEPEICMNYLIYYNLIYKFIQNIEFPCVQEFLQTLFNCSYNNSKISDEAFYKVTKYCEIVHFFTDITQVILIGLKGLDPKKFECDYKPNGIENLVRGSMNTSDLESLFDEKPISYRNDNCEVFLDDELNGINLDIDNLYGALDSQRKIDKQTLPIKKSFEKRIISKTMMNKYFSLKQKYEPTESILADIQDEGLRKSGADQITYSKQNSQIGSLKKLSETIEPVRSQFSRGKSNTLLNTKKSPESLINDSTSPAKGFLLPNPIEPVGSVKVYNDSEKSLRPLSNQRSMDIRLKTSEGKRDLRSSFDPRRGEGLRSLKTKLSTEPSDDYGSASLPQITNNRSHMMGSRQTLEGRRTGGKEVYVSPERMTLAKEFLSDTMTVEEAKKLNVLYPISHVARIENDIDKEAKGQEYTVNDIRANDAVAVPICILIESLIRKALFAPTHSGVERKGSFKNEENGKKFRYELKRRLGYLDVDYSAFWDAVFHTNSKFFSHLMKNYLFKIKVHQLEETNSGYAAGRIVNLLLEKCESHHDLKEYFEPIHHVCTEHVKFLSKVIIQSHAWSARKNVKIYMQNYEVKDALGTGRILLVETLYWIIKNDHANRYHVVQDINDTCWHTLILWFFNRRTNNIYHRLFFSILEVTFLNCNEKFLLTILMKLDFLSNMHKVWGEIYQNNVFLKDNHNESMICYLKKIAVLIDSIAQKNDQYVVLKSQLTASISWHDIKAKLCPVKDKKRESTTLHQNKRNTLKPKDAQILRMSPQSNSRISQNSHIKSRPDSRADGIKSHSNMLFSHHK